jgi:hypothetical protein
VTKHRNAYGRVVGGQASHSSGRRNIAKAALMSVYRSLVTILKESYRGSPTKGLGFVQELENPKNHGVCHAVRGRVQQNGKSHG